MPADFAGNAIGFYLQLDEQMSKPLLRAEKAYQRVTKAVDRFNKNVQARATKSADAIKRIGTELEMLPRRMKTSIVKIEKVLGRPTKERAAPRRADIRIIAAAIKHALGFKKFAEGGEVKGGTPGRDSVPAMLTPGEVVLPVDVVKGLQGVLRGPPGGPGFAKGGMVGAGGPGETIPPLQMDPMGMKDITKGLEELTDARRAYDKILAKGTGLTKKDWEAATELEAEMNKMSETVERKLSSKIMRLRRIAKLTGVPFKQLAIKMGITEKAIESLATIMDTSADGIQQSGTGILNTFAKIKEEAQGAMQEYGFAAPAIATASFAAAAVQDEAWHRIRENMKGGADDFEYLKNVGTTAMMELGVNTEEMNQILEQVAFDKLDKKQMKPFVNTAAKMTQGLASFGFTSEQSTDLLWNGLMKAGVAADRTENVVAGLIRVAKDSNIEFSALADSLKANTELFLDIKRHGGDAEKAMVEMAAAQGALSNAFMDPEVAASVMKDILDPQKWGDISGVMSQVGLDFGEMSEMMRRGDIGEAQARLMEAWGNVPESQLDFFKSSMEEIFNISSDQLELAVKGGPEIAKSIREQAAAADEARKQGQLLNDMFERYQKTFSGMVDRIWNKLIPALLTVGEKFLWVAEVAMTPVMWLFDALAKIWSYLPGPVQTLAAAIVGLVAAYTALKVVMAIVKSMAILQSVWTGLIAAKTGIWAAATWILNSSLGAMAIAGWAAVAPWLPFIAIAAAVVGALYLVYKGIEWVVDAVGGWGSVWEGLKTVMMAALLPILVPLYLIYKVIEGLIGVLWDLGSVIYAALAEPFGEVWDFISGVWDQLLELPGKLLDGFLGVGSSILKAIIWPYKKAWEWISSLFSGGLDIGKTLVASLSAAITGMWEGVKEWFLGIVRSLMRPVGDALFVLADGLHRLGSTDTSDLVEAYAIKVHAFSTGGDVPLQKGGIVTEETRAILGEAGAEAVIPLDRLPQIIQEAGEPPVVNIDNTEIVVMLKKILAQLRAGGSRPGVDAIGRALLGELRA